MSSKGSVTPESTLAAETGIRSAQKPIEVYVI